MSAKVFVGNLSFKTREPDLAKAFEEVGPVKSTNIIARGPRSLGYGFVEFEKAEDAVKSVGVMNKKEIDGRPVNVEVARAREFAPAPAVGGAPVAAGGVPMAARPQPRRNPRFGAPRRFPVAPQQGAAAPVGSAPLAAVPQGAPIPGQFRRPQRRFAPRVVPQGGVAPQAPIQGGVAQQPRPFVPRRPVMRRVPRAPRPQTGEMSKTTLFVANLPFVVDDAGLLEIFEGMNVKEAHVVTRQNGRSKGYGFVSFATEADQLRAMQTVDKSLVENREISVHPAFSQPPVVAAVAPVAAAPVVAPVVPAVPAPVAPVVPVVAAETK